MLQKNSSCKYFANKASNGMQLSAFTQVLYLLYVYHCLFCSTCTLQEYFHFLIVYASTSQHFEATFNLITFFCKRKKKYFSVTMMS